MALFALVMNLADDSCNLWPDDNSVDCKDGYSVPFVIIIVCNLDWPIKIQGVVVVVALRIKWLQNGRGIQ
jgi:hypothetical protein